MKLQQLLEQDFRYMFHMTTKAAWPSIKQRGLLPQDAKGEWAHIGYKNKTFLFADPSGAAQQDISMTLLGRFGNEYENWSDAQWDKFHDSLVVLTIDTSKVPDFYIATDPNSGGEWYQTSVPIPPEAIISVNQASFDADDDF